jgi:hypothetical protein
VDLVDTEAGEGTLLDSMVDMLASMGGMVDSIASIGDSMTDFFSTLG